MFIVKVGRPTDLDHYEGSHGINDIRKAVFEAEANGNRVVALTLDKQVRPHFKKMFTRFEMIKSPDQLAESLFKLIYSLFK